MDKNLKSLLSILQNTSEISESSKLSNDDDPLKIINVKSGSNLELLLPILKNKIDNPDNVESLSSESDDSYSETETSSESLDTEIYNFDKQLDDENILFLLNAIGQIYSSKNGFEDTKSIVFISETNKDLIQSFIEESKEEGYYIDEIGNRFTIDVDFFEQKSTTCIPYEKVIIKHKVKHDISEKYKEKWIKVDNSQVVISNKGKSITIDDILYATRVIAVSYHETNMVRTIFQEFKLLSTNDDTLILEY